MLWRQFFKKQAQPVAISETAVQPFVCGYVLEARMLFDGAIAATVEQTTDTHTTEPQTASTTAHTTSAETASQSDSSCHAGQDAGNQSSATKNTSTDSHSTDSNSTTSTASNGSDVAAVAGATVHKEVVFIDTSVAGYQTLVANVPAGMEVVLLDGSKDGLTQMAVWAQTHSGYDAIHVLSHGSEGAAQLGTLTLNSATAQARANNLATLGAALNADGDLLLYGCDVAQASGQQFASLLAQLTSADVAASTNPTGAAALGGDWVTEFHTGEIGVQDLVISSYNNLLSVNSTSVTVTAYYNPATEHYASTPVGSSVEFDNNSNPIDIDPTNNTVTITYSSGASLDTAFDLVFQGGSLDHFTGITKTFSSGDNANDVTATVSGKTIHINVGAGGFTNGTIVFTFTSVDVSTDSAPSVIGSATNPTYTENGSGINLFSGISATTNDSGQTFSGAVFTVSNVTDTTEYLTINGVDITLTNGTQLSLGSGYGTVSVSKNGNTATVTLTGASLSDANMSTLLSGITYRNSSETPTETSRTVTLSQLTDSGGSNNTASPNLSCQVTVTAVNDAPVISNTSVSKTVNEDSAQTFNAADFGFSDADSIDTLQSITIVTAPAAGELFIDANNDGVRDSGDTLLGNGAVVSAADISRLTFRPTANANGAGYAAFTWQVSDGTALSANTGTMTLNVTPVNDAPVISNTSVSKTVNENSVQTFNPADFGFSDADSIDTLQSITIVTAPAAGELFIDANNDGVRDSGDTLLGNGAVVSAANISKLTFRPTANANGAGYAAFTWQVSDGTALSANTGTMTLNVTPVNDAPVISNTSVSKTVNENSVQTFNPADFGFSDVDSSDTLQSITIVTAPTAGELFIDANNDGVRDSGDTLLGNGAVVSAADISRLTFRPTANANGAGYAAFTWQVSDGTALSANTGTMTLNVTPVNDAPVISNTSVSKTVNENSVQTFNPADFGFSDADSIDTLQSITIVTAPAAGELFIDANNDGVRDSGDTLLGNGAVVSAANISKLTFRPTANANGAGYAAFTWQVSDGTALSANTGTMTLNVTPVNDAPVISNTSVSKTVNENSVQTFNPADFGFSDADSIDTLQSITIVTAPAAGELFIDANNDGVRDSGDTLLGNGAVVSAANISKLTFRPTANANGAGYAAFTWQVSDGTALSANTGTMTLNVTPVNDAPVISNTSVSKTVNENSVQTFNPADFGFSDVDSSDTLQSITIVTAPTAGELFIDANNDGVRDSGDTLLGNGAVVSAADISKLTFRPTANANGAGYAAFTWQVSDGTALSANTGTMTLNVTPVNDAPTLSSGDPQFRISDGTNGSRPVDSRVPTIQSQVAGTPPLNTWITSSSLGSFNAGHTAGSSSIMASIFTATSDGVSGEDATKSDVANIFRHSSSFSSHFESSLGSFPSFSKDPAQGGTSSLASVFSDIYLPSLTPMEVFTGGSWKDINLHAQGATELGPEQATTAFTPSFPRQLQHIGEAEGQRLSAIAQALFEQSQLQG
ncbi:DUF4347 domain-containing protein [Plesiomonas sp. PI-19]|nr:DUF4347 domain-containing protein [Plesiomonas sp. PI-19]MCE5164131.1 tandem-95 repeat protein [Plesiomonas sp. PI-19]